MFKATKLRASCQQRRIDRTCHCLGDPLHAITRPRGEFFSAKNQAAVADFVKKNCIAAQQEMPPLQLDPDLVLIQVREACSQILPEFITPPLDMAAITANVQEIVSLSLRNAPPLQCDMSAVTAHVYQAISDAQQTIPLSHSADPPNSNDFVTIE